MLENILNRRFKTQSNISPWPLLLCALAIAFSAHASLPLNVPLTAAPSTTTSFPASAFSQNATNASFILSAVYTAQNGTVTICDGAIAYTPAFGFSGRDSFNVTITNSTGGSSSALALVTVQAPPALVMQPGGAVQLRLVGAAGVTFNIQASTNFSSWANIGSAVAGSNGLVLFTDTNAANFSSRYYRLSTP